MTTSQSGIFDRRFQHHLFCEFSLGSGRSSDDIQQVLQQLAALSTEKTPVLLAFGPALWARLNRHFDFPPFSLQGLVPATQGELLIWAQASDRGELFDVGQGIRKAVADTLSLQLEIDGFVYHDMRDLTGFVDGIGNPAGEAAEQAAIIAEPHPGAGGSWVLTQQWIHQLDKFNALPQGEQENVIGRTKPDAVEFDEERMPDDAHVGRVDVKRDGVAQKIWRRSVPFGSMREHGLYFVAFSCELDRFDYLLRRMYGRADDSVRDRLLDYSRPVMSSWWYAPSQDWLDQNLA